MQKLSSHQNVRSTFFSIEIRINNHGDLPVANKNWLKRVSLNRILNESSVVSCPGVPYSSVPARESVAGCHVVPFFTRRTSVHPPPSIASDQAGKRSNRSEKSSKATAYIHMCSSCHFIDYSLN